MSRPALGLIETKGLSGAIQATHAATKAGQVTIASAERTEAGYMVVKIEGDWHTVQAAVEAGARAAEQAGELVSMHIIPRTDNGITSILPYRRFMARYNPEQRPTSATAAKKPRPVAPTKPKKATPITERAAKPEPPDTPSTLPVVVTAPAPAKPPAAPPPTNQPAMEELRKMSVVNLRRYARSVPDLPIQGRQISLANKETLLSMLERVAASKNEK